MLYKITHFLTNKIWILVILIIGFVTVYAVVGRQLIQIVPEYRTQLEEMIEARSGLDVQIDDMRGRWTLFTPVIELSKVSFIQSASNEKVFSAKKISLEIDLLASLIVRELRLRRVVLIGFSATLDDKLLDLSDNKNNVADNEKGESDAEKKNPSPEERKKNKEKLSKNIALGQMIFRQRDVQLQDATVVFQREGKPARTLSNINAQFENVAGKHSLSGKAYFGAGRQLLEFSANANGFPMDENTKTNIYGHLHNGDILSWLPEDIQNKFKFKRLKINSLMLDSQLWLTWHKGYLKNIVGNINAEEIGLVPVASSNSSKEIDGKAAEKTNAKIKQDAIPKFHNVSVSYSVAPLKLKSFKHGFKARLSGLEFEWDDCVWEGSNFLIDVNLPSKVDPLKFDLNASEVDLGCVADFLLVTNSLSNKAKGIVDKLKPSGKLEDISFKYNYSNKTKFKFDVRLNNVSVKEWKGVPGIRNLSAKLSMTNHAGYLQVNARNAIFESTRYLRQPIYVARLTGPIQWEAAKKRHNKKNISVHSGILELENSDVKGKLMFSLATPDDELFPTLTLLADINKAPAEKISFYLPPVIPSGALKWLDNGILAGKAKGAIVYHGPVGANALTPYNHSLQSLVFVTSGEIDFDPGKWPKIKNSAGNIYVHNNIVDFNFPSGNVYDGLLSNVIGHVGPSGKNSIWQLELSGHIAASTSDGLKVLQESTLKETLNDVAGEWTGKGKLEIDLELTMPFEGDDVDNPDINVDIALKGSDLYMSDFDLDFSNINGTLNYSNDSGLTSSSLKTKLFSNNAVVNIKPVDRKKHEVFKVSIKSKVDAKTLYAWSDQPLVAFMEGGATYNADLKVVDKPKEDIYTELVVNSNLVGLEVHMPSVFNKSSETVSPLLFNMKWQGDETYLFLGRQHVFNSVLLFDKNELIKSELIIGGHLASLPDKNKLYAKGHLEKLLWPEWERFFDALEIEYQKMETANNKNNKVDNTGDDLNEFLNLIGEINLKMDYFEGFGMELDNVTSVITRDGPAWLVQSKNVILSGLFKIPDGEEPLDFKLDYLHLPDEEAPYVSVSDYSPVIEEPPIEFPAFNAIIKDFKYGNKDFGLWEVTAYPTDQFYKIESIKIQIDDLIFTGQGQWASGKPYSKTTFKGDVKTRDVGDLLASWGYPVTIETKSGHMSYDISWPHSPIDFNTDYLDGKVQLRFKDGRFLEVEGAASAIRVMGIMNFSTLGRRLRLDFTDLFKSGLSFDRIEGPVKFKNGNMFLKDFVINGPSTHIEARGKLDYINEEVDLGLEVSLPLSGNMLPLVTLLAGPLAGGGWYVADRLFGDKIDRAFGMTYRVSNTFDDPKIESIPRLLD